MKKEEFIKVINAYKEIIYKVCLIYCPDLEKRRFLEQKILFELWNTLKNNENGANQKEYIYRIIINSAISFYFTKKIKKANIIEYSNTIIEYTNKLDFVNNDELSDFFKLDEHLNRFEKALIFLYLEDLSDAKIKEILSFKENSIHVKLNQITKNLTEKLNDKKIIFFEFDLLKDIWQNKTLNINDDLKINLDYLNKSSIFKNEKFFTNAVFSLRKLLLIISLVLVAASVFIFAKPDTKNIYFLTSLYLNVIIIYLCSSFFRYKEIKKMKGNAFSVLPFQKEFNLFEKSFLLFKKIDFLIAPITFFVLIFSALILFEKFNPILVYKNHQNLPVFLIIVSITILVLEFLSHSYYLYLYDKKTKNVHRILRELKDFESDI